MTRNPCNSHERTYTNKNITFGSFSKNCEESRKNQNYRVNSGCSRSAAAEYVSESHQSTDKQAENLQTITDHTQLQILLKVTFLTIVFSAIFTVILQFPVIHQMTSKMCSKMPPRMSRAAKMSAIGCLSMFSIDSSHTSRTMTR